MDELINLKSKVASYNEILTNTQNYRNVWQSDLKNFIIKRLEHIISQTGLKAEIQVNTQMENLESIVLSLGKQESGIGEKLSENATRPLIKHNGMLIYQQLFNGKVEVLLVLPFIEGYGKPAPPKMVAIYRPEEIIQPFIIRHVELFLKEVVNWEDYDDDQQIPAQPIGFQLPFGPQGAQK